MQVDWQLEHPATHDMTKQKTMRVITTRSMRCHTTLQNLMASCSGVVVRRAGVPVVKRPS